MKESKKRIEKDEGQTKPTAVLPMKPAPGRPAKQTAPNGLSGGPLVVAIFAYIIGGVNGVLTIYNGLVALFLGGTDSTVLLNFLASLIMTICFLAAAITMTRQQRIGKHLAEVAVIAAFVCSLVVSLPGVIDSFPSNDYNCDNSPSNNYNEELLACDMSDYASNSSSQSLAHERALYTTIWIFVYLIRAGLVGLVLVYLEKSQQIKDQLTK